MPQTLESALHYEAGCLLFYWPMCRTCSTLQYLQCPDQLTVVPSHQLSQYICIGADTICVIVKVLQSAHPAMYNTWEVKPKYLYSPLPQVKMSSEVVIIVSVPEVTVRDGIHRFTLLDPLFPRLCRLWILRKGQIGSDAVPDAVAQHVVAAAVWADQLFSAR